jgi:hypothetical protein
LSDITPLYCANHPQIETSLRCNQCEKPICSKCAVLSPTGYRCRECVSSRQKVFETAQTIDYWLAFPAAAILSLIGSLFVARIGLYAILVGPIVGTIIAEAVRFVTRKRRSKKLFLTAAAGVIAGCAPVAIFRLFMMGAGAYLAGAEMLVYSAPSLVYLAIYAGLAASTLYYRLAGISI